MTQAKVRVCPRCGSPHIRAIANTVGGWLVPTTYYCEHCDYSGSVYVEVEASEVEGLQHAINDDPV